MLTRKELKDDLDERTQNGFVMDEETKKTMKALNLKMFRSAKNRSLDRKKAIAKYGKKVNLSEYAIHHRFDGLVGLVPRELHKSIPHNGYFYRLEYTTV